MDMACKSPYCHQLESLLVCMGCVVETPELMRRASQRWCRKGKEMMLT